MQAVFRLPGTVVPAACESEREPVVQVVPVELDEDDSDPVAEGKRRVLLQGETVATLCDRLLEPDRGKRVYADIEAEGDEGEDAHNNSDRTNADEDGSDPNFGLLSISCGPNLERWLDMPFASMSLAAQLDARRRK